MKNNVVMPAAFAGRADAEMLSRLREQGVVTGVLLLDERELKEPEYGEDTLGILTEGEAQMYAAYWEAHKALKDMQRKVGAAMLHRLGDAVSQQKEREALDKEPPLTEAEAQAFHKALRKVDYLKNMFFWVIGEKYSAHDFTLGVRTKRRIVKGRRKW